MLNKPTQTAIPEGQPPLIRLTDAAVNRVTAMLTREGKQDCGLRVAVITGGCAGLSYDLSFQKKPYDNDRVVEQGALRIFVNQESAGFLKGLLIDYKDTLKESGFQYHNPNAQSSCSCGTSFS